MFNDLVESSVAKDITRKPWTVTVSVFVQIFLVGVLILIPLVHTQALPKAMLKMIMMAPTPPPASAPPTAPQTRTPRQPTRFREAIFTAPQSIPSHVDMTAEPAAPEIEASPATGVPGGVPNGSPTGVPDGLMSETAPAAPPAPVARPQRIRKGGAVQAAMLINQPMPEYPPLARQARIQGDVVLHAIISKDGRVEQLSVISGHPLLIQAALDAVRQWRYQPTLLNNVPVEVDTTITVKFTMGSN